jgi:hypothetical protein
MPWVQTDKKKEHMKDNIYLPICAHAQEVGENQNWESHILYDPIYEAYLHICKHFSTQQ